MFSPQVIKAARKNITAENKVYLSGDGSAYIVERSRDISGIIKNCEEANIELFDVEENKNIVEQAQKKTTKK